MNLNDNRPADAEAARLIADGAAKQAKVDAKRVAAAAGK